MKKALVILAIVFGTATSYADTPQFADDGTHVTESSEPSAPDAPPLEIQTTEGAFVSANGVLVPAAPGSLVVAVTASGGETYTVHSATGLEVDGERVLLAEADTAPAETTAPAPSAGENAGSATVAAPDAGSSSSAATPADKLHDPVSAPGAAWDDVKAAKKVGWPVLVFVVLIMLCKLLSRAKSLPYLAALGKGKAAVAIGALGALGAACYNAAADGGAWTALLVAGLVAIGHYFDADKKAEA